MSRQHNRGDDVMTMAAWLDAVANGSFIDYDGFGYYATAEEAFPELGRLKPSMVKAGSINKEHTHVVWFNR